MDGESKGGGGGGGCSGCSGGRGGDSGCDGDHIIEWDRSPQLPRTYREVCATGKCAPGQDDDQGTSPGEEAEAEAEANEPRSMEESSTECQMHLQVVHSPPPSPPRRQHRSRSPEFRIRVGEEETTVVLPQGEETVTVEIPTRGRSGCPGVIVRARSQTPDDLSLIVDLPADGADHIHIVLEDDSSGGGSPGDSPGSSYEEEQLLVEYEEEDEDEDEDDEDDEGVREVNCRLQCMIHGEPVSLERIKQLVDSLIQSSRDSRTTVRVTKRIRCVLDAKILELDERGDVEFKEALERILRDLRQVKIRLKY